MAISNGTAVPGQIPPPLEPAHNAISEHRRSFASLRVILALMLREVSTTYGRSPGGYIWAFLEPIGTIAIMSLAFSLIMRSPSLGNSFILFYASGFLVFTLYRNIEKVVTGAIQFSRALLLYPAVSWLDAIIARFLLNLLTDTLTMILILGGILLASNTGAELNMFPMVIAVFLAALLGLGLGTLHCLMSGLFPLWKTAYKIVSRPLMLASAVLYILEDLPSQAGDILWWNPLAHVTGLMRSGIYPSYHPQYISVPYVAGFALVPFALGLLFLRRYHSDLINKSS